jgi:PTH1 family peptidyl-tRNA hydrolase
VKLVVGLGNVPEFRYAGTRHNVGFEVVEAIVKRQQLSWDVADVARLAVTARWRRAPGDAVLFAKPQTLMNLSGDAVRQLTHFYRVAPTDLLIACDDVNLPLGVLRARASGTEGGHKGLRSVAESMGTIDYARLRVGVGRGDNRRDLADHVLARFDPDEQPAIADAIVRAADAIEMWLTDGLVKVMNMYNQRGSESS